VEFKLFKHNFCFSCGMAGKIDNSEGNGVEIPRFGRYWWYWLPHIHHNNGKFWKREVTDINFMFMCYWFAITIWGN
jgi:hypothetical protein